MGSEPAISPAVTEIGSKDSDDLARQDAEPDIEPEASTSAAVEPTAPVKPTRKRKRPADKMPTWFAEFMEKTEKSNEAQLELLHKMHDDKQKAQAERLKVMQDLNNNVKELIKKI